MEKKEAGNAAFSAGDWNRATQLYTEALAQDPSLAAAWANRAACFLKVGEWGKGLADCERGIALPDVATSLRTKLWYRRALCERELGRLYLTSVHKGLELEPHNPSLLQLLEPVESEIKIREFDEMPLEYTRAISTGPRVVGDVTFVAPGRPLTYSSIVSATRSTSNEAYDWWYQELNLDELVKAHNGAGIDPQTLDYVYKMVKERGGERGRELLTALRKCDRFSTASLMADPEPTI